jgi:hypothetical protein
MPENLLENGWENGWENCKCKPLNHLNHQASYQESLKNLPLLTINTLLNREK